MCLRTKVASCPTSLRIASALKDGTIWQREVHALQLGFTGARTRTTCTSIVRNSVRSTCFVVNSTTGKVRSFRAVVVIIGINSHGFFGVRRTGCGYGLLCGRRTLSNC